MLQVDIERKAFVTADGDVLEAIEGLRFAVAAGTFTCLVGPSGCGKTTTLRILLGLERGFEGSFRLPGAEGRLGVIFQEPRLLPWRTVEQNIRLAMPPARRGRDVSPLLARLGLDGMRGFFPAELSLGLARRAAIARAFAIDPEVLILDEPFVSLDEPTAVDLRALLMSIWTATRPTAVMVTHNLREAAALSDQIVLLTPRPARLRGIVPIDTPRAERTPERIEAIVAAITRDYPGVL